MTLIDPAENESDRLAALYALDVLDTPAEASFDRIVTMLTTVLDVPMAAICLLDENRVWFKAAAGLSVTEIPRELALCTRTTLQREPLIIADLQDDPNWRDLKLVTELDLRFYAGVPLVTSTGHPLGTLCVADRQPRQLNDEQINALKDMSFLTTELLETRAVATKLRETQDDLSKQRARLEHLTMLAECQVEGSLDGILIVDNDRRVVSYNKRFAEMWGISAEVIASKCDQTVIQSVLGKLQDPDDFMRRTAELYQTPHEQCRDELHLIDGRSFERYTSAVKNSEGETFGRIWFFRDISDKKHYERELEQHKLVVENSSAVLFRWRAEEGWPVELVSENVSQFGYSARELLDGRVNFATLVFDEDLERVADEIKHYSEKGVDSFEQEYRMVCRDGEVRWMYDRTVVERDEAGNATHFQGIVIDITDRKRNEETSLRLLSDLEERVKEMRTLNSVLRMLHDLEADLPATLQQVVEAIPDGFQFPNNTYASLRLGHEVYYSRGYRRGEANLAVPFHNSQGVEGMLEVVLHGYGAEEFGAAVFLDEERQLIETIAELLESYLERHRAQEQLQQQKVVVDNSNTLFFRWRIAPNWPVEMVSENIRRFGYEASDLLRGEVNFEQIVHPDDRRRIEQEVVACYESGGESVEQEYRIICRDGEVRWVFDRTTAERDANGVVTHLQGTLTDITERKVAEDALRISEERLRNIASQVPGALYQFHIAPDGTRSFPYISEGVYDLCGVSAEELDSDSTAIMQGIVPEDVDAVEASIQESARTLRPWQCEFRIRHRDGSLRWIGGNSIPQRELDGATLWHGLIMDITERMEAQTQLRGLTAIIEASTDFIGQATADGEPVYINPAGRRMIGLGLDEPLTGARITDYSPPWAARRLVDEVLPAVNRDGAWLGELALRHRDGHEIPVSQLVMAHRNDHGELEHFSTVIRDVTLQKQARDALQQARDAAEAASLAKSEFLANMSHEIRTPLTAILGFAELLRHDADIATSTERRKETVDTILSAGKHLLSVINDILDISKIEAGELNVDAVETSILQVVKEVAGLMQVRAAEKNIQLNVQLRTPVPDAVITDATRLKQILMNLAGNAVKFTQRGAVTISVQMQESAGQPQLVAEVLDTGPGMTAAQAERLFTAFFQCDSSVTRKHGGTGLGLIISRRLAELLDGSVELIWTAPGEGSCFRMTLPVMPVEGAALVHELCEVCAPRPVLSPAEPLPLRGRILVAEDGLENQRLIAFHLQKAGANVDVADNGAEAFAMIQQAQEAGEPFDLLLTDIQMPDMDGCTLTRNLREQGSTMPIIALTAHAMSEDRKRCLAAGCDDYAVKPIDRATLLRVCHAWMGRAGGQGGQIAA